MAKNETKTETNENPLRFGAVAILDALGFKGLWGRFPPEELARALRMHKVVFSTARTGINADPESNRFRFLCLSDTLVFATITKLSADMELTKDARSDARVAVYQTIRAAQAAIMLALGQNPALNFRGCIAAGAVYGDDEDYLIGGAVDDAAEYMDEADGAFVWLLPSATRLLRKSDQRGDAAVVRFPVPMHGGRTVEVPVVNPFDSLNEVEARRHLEKKAIEAFTDPKRLGGRPPSLEVVAKMQNTKRFLQEAERVTAERYAAHSDEELRGEE